MVTNAILQQPENFTFQWIWHSLRIDHTTPDLTFKGENMREYQLWDNDWTLHYSHYLHSNQNPHKPFSHLRLKTLETITKAPNLLMNNQAKTYLRHHQRAPLHLKQWMTKHYQRAHCLFPEKEHWPRGKALDKHHQWPWLITYSNSPSRKHKENSGLDSIDDLNVSIALGKK